MIARLVGKLAETSADSAIVDAQGVGYLVQASARTLDSLGPVGGDVTILTELQVREDGWTLFGFGSTGEREAFRQLTSVQGVGGRVALAILSVLDPGELAAAVGQGDKAMVARANGVGPKLAQRIVNELAGKLGSPALAGAIGSSAPRGGAAADALSALANLGFKPAEASAAVSAANEELGPDAGLDALVRLALKKGSEVIIAIFSAKGGVGKTTLAVNLAWASATISKRRTLIWDLDAQAAATYILGQDPSNVAKAERSIIRDSDPARLIRPTAIDRLDLLPADASLRGLEHSFHDLGKRKRLAKVSEHLTGDYDRIIIDCPPGMTDTADQILRASDLAVVPVIPAALSRRALDEIKQHVAQKKGPKVLLAPIFSMVDRRRALHRNALASQPGWPVIPMASAYERMSEERAPIGELMPRSAMPVEAVAEVWHRIEKALKK